MFRIAFMVKGERKEVERIAEWFDKNTAIVIAKDGNVYAVHRKEMVNI